MLCRGHVGLMIVKRVLSPLSHFPAQAQVYEVLLLLPSDLVLQPLGAKCCGVCLGQVRGLGS